MSHPTWVRGLKSFITVPSANATKSHPTWVRGLKYKSLAISHLISKVAPHVGAWIEIFVQSLEDTYHLSRTPRGCVD